MKKILLSLTLLFGLNHSINSSYSTYFVNSAKGAGVLLAAVAGNMLGNKPMENQLEATKMALHDISLKLVQRDDQINQLTEKIGSFGKKEPSFLDKLGTTGIVLGALFTGYRYLQYAESEFRGFLSIMNLLNYAKHTFKDKLSSSQAVEESKEESERPSRQKIERMTPAQRTAFLRQHGFKG